MQPTDSYVEIAPGHRALNHGLDEAIAYAVKSKSHLWTAIATFKVAPEVLANTEAKGLLDHESLLSIVIGCVVCEAPYDAHLRHRACPGEPTS